MLIYIEGLDHAGKSTFAKKLSTLLGYPVYQKKLPASVSVHEHHNYFKGVGFTLVELHNLFRFCLITDRCFISDWVYSNRTRSRYGLSVWREWEARHVDPSEVVVVFVNVPGSTLAKRLRKKPDQYLSVGDVARCEKLYWEYFRQTRFQVMSVSGTLSPREAKQQVRKVAKNIAAHAQKKK